MEARRRVREHILRIDDTFKRHDFVYRALEGGSNVTVLTPEEIQYSTFAARGHMRRKKDSLRQPATVKRTRTKGLLNEVSGIAEIFNGQTEEEQTSISDIIRSGESNTVEFKSSLRMNLHTNRPDPKIEHAVLRRSRHS